MLECQRDAFDIPRDVAYLNAASWSPLPHAVQAAGQAGIAGHLRIGDRVTLAAQSGVMHHIPEGQKWMGSPAQPDRITKRQLLAIERLPDLLRRVHELERRLGEREG